MRRRPGLQTVARRYARALLDVALPQGEAERVRRELHEALEVLATHPELKAALQHPAVAAEKRQKVVAEVWGHGRACALTLRLLELLAGRNRLDLLPDLESAYAALWNEHRGVVSAEAVSALPLPAEQEQALAGAIRRATGREVELRSSVDPSLRGGVLVRMLGRTFDGSVRGRLRAMRERLAQGAVRA